jgi:cell division septation protein DedD
MACAPPASGVYGLFNFECQLFIGEADNIQEALLRLEDGADFHSPHLQPTGYAFELCPPESRKSRAAELIKTFQPVLQVDRASAETWAAQESPARGTSPENQELDHDFPVHQEEKPRKDRRPVFSRWSRAACLVTVFVASAAAILYVGLPVIKTIQQRANAAGEEPVADLSTGQRPSSVQIAARPAIAKSEGRANHSAEPAITKAEIRQSAVPSTGGAKLAVRSAFTEDSLVRAPAAGRSNASATSEPEASPDAAKKWSVQIAAVPSKDIADALMQRLKANGYSGYVVQAEVKGQTYHRVRVGRFATRAEAESARDSLAREESYRDAYLTGD